ncbi:TIGR02757 family protein [Nitratiruptor tergarcus]|uniref:TIGR02757 family protein n=1 Tax=Nitratiruptor tergarcus DSM 16512 TaxID=1069081 RepID=A0A1W1WTX5_9BACT|nr:TIGR02757 family protein [Nitratiruptor tergarcus]SMC09768.1 TIGR02757 family protein [Nitratiruptor tergarcus DSM 16512]
MESILVFDDLKASLELARKEFLHRSKHPQDHPDPLFVARKYKDEKIALVCALFAYGNAKQIVKFLKSLDFSLLACSEKEIKKITSYYRFQNSQDVANLFITLRRIDSLQEHFLQGYKKDGSVMGGLRSLIAALRKINRFSSPGYDFLLGKLPHLKYKGVSAYKRWHMFLRWMVRKDDLDMGLWSGVEKSDLIIPLDTHTFNVSRKLGLLHRKQYDLAAAMELTNNLKKFDPHDPVKYDFALYRLGQTGVI